MCSSRHFRIWNHQGNAIPALPSFWCCQSVFPSVPAGDQPVLAKSTPGLAVVGRCWLVDDDMLAVVTYHGSYGVLSAKMLDETPKAAYRPGKWKQGRRESCQSSSSSSAGSGAWLESLEPCSCFDGDIGNPPLQGKQVSDMILLTQDGVVTETVKQSSAFKRCDAAQRAHETTPWPLPNSLQVFSGSWGLQ